MNATIKKNFPAVQTVVDSTAPIVVEVTPQDVRASKRRNHTECAMAVACRRMLKADGMIIGKQTVYLIKGTKAASFGIPESVRKELSKPPHRLGSRGGSSSRAGKSRRHIHVTTNVRSNIAVFD